MTWGGSISLDGSNYLRKLREIEKVLKFLEEFKKGLNSKDTESINKIIDLIIDYVNTFQRENRHN